MHSHELYLYVDLMHFMSFILYKCVGSRFGGKFHCRCERTQTEQAQSNEFGREAGLRTGPL